MKRVIIIKVFIFCISVLLAANRVVITEIMYDTPLNEDTTRVLHNHGEFVELYNDGRTIVDLSGWSLETKDPHQVFNIPSGVTLNPYSLLVIAYGDDNIISYSVEDFTIEEYCEGRRDFHWLYDIDHKMYQIILQTALILPNQHTALLLKDDMGVTQDSVIYEDPHPESLNKARNNYDAGVYKGCLKRAYSLQRMRVSPNYDGRISYYPNEWLGKFMNTPTSGFTNNSVGLLTEYFSGSDDLINKNQTTKETSYNYVQEIIPNVARRDIDTSQLFTSSMPAMVKRTYYDPLDRPILTFSYNYTPKRNHLVTFKEYDGYARLSKDWLPIAVEENNLTDKLFKNSANLFYGNDSRSFVEQIYSTESWDNGIIKNELIGSQKAGADMIGYGTEYVSRGNDSIEIKLFQVTSEGLLQCTGYYTPKMLRVTETKDEDNHTKLVYTNQHGQTVMEKMDVATTYYVYNDLNQLCYVLPPLAVEQLAEGTYAENHDVIKKYAYVYKYDERGNQIYKRLPGCEPVLMVYDKSNLLVMAQNGNQRSRGTYWTVYKYDQLRRPIYTAEIKVGEESYEYYLQAFAGWLMLESFSTGVQTRPMGNTGYSRVFFSSQSTKLLTVNYYDNYDFLLLMSDSVRENMGFVDFEDNPTYANAKGLLTGTRTYYLDGSGNYSETAYYYDYRGREIQRRTRNHLGGYDVLSTKYDFVNNVMDTWASQSISDGVQTTEHYHYEYDHANRMTTSTYTFNNEPAIKLQSFHYDELGRVRSRHIYDGIDSVAFAYDIRNQVTQIKSSSYEQKYYYNQPCPNAGWFSLVSYNGNISATTWTYGNNINGYTFDYDKMNRLKSTYSILDGLLNVDNLYSENFNYDLHGNITRLDRWDEDSKMDFLTFTYDGNQLQSIDDSGVEAYRYDAKHYHDNNATSTDYAYDANGNLIYDQDRGIAAIRYNLLNLPDTIQFTNGNLIIHRYDATGNRLESKYLTKKIATTVPLGNVLSTPKRPEIFYITRDAFCNNIVYTANNNDPYGMEFVHNPEGYIRYYGPEEHYHFYYIKDLLGNIRETYVHPEAGYKECIQRMQYYPSGLPWAEIAGASEQPWKYNGKEFVEMHGLDEYDSKARWYYPAICRTTTMDPLAEKYYSTSPYAWCGNNPIKHVDRNGKWIESAWDAANVVIGVKSLITNIQEHNIQDAVIDGAGLILDVAAVILPAVPGGVSTAIKTARVVDNVSDVVNVTTRTATKHNYRKVLQETTGKVGDGFEAHHTLPQKYRKQFEALDINIDEPGNVVWRKKENHRKQNYQHTKAWDKEYEDLPNKSKDDVYKLRDQIENEIFENLGDTPLE